ncbi:MAG: hypothetical protein HYZ42_07825 [Bacteroidetes bacterium]|nr:hypothetical protein [Bacteroidota bacterium]
MNIKDQSFFEINENKAINELFIANKVSSNIILNKKFEVIAFNKRAKDRFYLQLNLVLQVGHSFINYLPVELKNETINDLKLALTGTEVSKLSYIDKLKNPLWING